jgi:hypothetical protein
MVIITQIAAILGILTATIMIFIRARLKTIIAGNLLFIAIINIVIWINILILNTPDVQLLSLEIGGFVMISGLSYIWIKETRNIEISIPEYMIITIVLGLGLYQFFINSSDPIDNPILLYGIIIPIASIIASGLFLWNFISEFKKVIFEQLYPELSYLWRHFNGFVYSNIGTTIGFIFLIVIGSQMWIEICIVITSAIGLLTIIRSISFPKKIMHMKSAEVESI